MTYSITFSARTTIAEDREIESRAVRKVEDELHSVRGLDRKIFGFVPEIARRTCFAEKRPPHRSSRRNPQGLRCPRLLRLHDECSRPLRAASADSISRDLSALASGT